MSELEQRMGGDEFLEHMADYSLSPWGEDREDIRTAAMMEVNAAAHGGKLTRRQAYNSITMDGKKEGPPEMTEAQMKGALRMFG